MNIIDNTIQALTHRRSRFQQSENADLGYSVNWAAVLGADTISTSAWESTPSLTISSEADSGNVASANITGSVGEYLITNKIVSAAGITDERIFSLRITDNDEPLVYEQDYNFCV